MFGSVENETVILSPIGTIVHDEWLRTPTIRKEVHLDDSIVMPEHFHAIVAIGTNPDEIPWYTGRSVGAHGSAPYPHETKGDNQENPTPRRPRSLSSLIAQFKSVTTHQINTLRGTPGRRVWQRGFDDRIIRNVVQLDHYRAYIRNNPKSYRRA